MIYTIVLIKMSSPSAKKLRRLHVGALPLIDEIMRQIGLREIIADYIPASGRESVPPADVIGLLVANMTIAKDPLYELAQWVESLDLRALGYRKRPAACFSDDRFGRALDKLYYADRASLMTRLVVAAIKTFDVQLNRIHNDSTTVKAFGRIPGRTRTGLELRHGHSKDHRPDLKQLVYNLSITDDGAVPIHHKVYSGNRNDATTHIETWETLRKIHGAADFLYVADCKLCTQKQLAHIVDNGGRAVTILPQNFTEVHDFKQQLRAGARPKRLLWRRPKPMDETGTEYFYLFDGSYRTTHGHSLYWFVSSEKRLRDRHSRRERLQQAEAALAQLAPKLNARRLKRKPDILRAAEAILQKYHLEGLLNIDIQHHVERWLTRKRGRPGKRVQYQHHCRVSYSLHWSRNTDALRAEARTDGVFPLLCTDPDLAPGEVLKAYKFQPQLEKRFCQFKSIHRAAPLLFKKIRRVEANMFVFFLALMIQALLERKLRQRLAQRKFRPLKLYPEDRDAPHPTTSQLFKTFDGLSTYAITHDDHLIEEYRDDLNATHKQVLALLGISEEDYWKTA